MAVLVVTYDNSTGGFKVQKVGSAQISDGAVISAKIASGIVGTVHLRDLNVTSAKLTAALIASIEAGGVADESVTSAKLASGAVVGNRVAVDGIVSSHIGANVIGGIHILAGAIVSAKIGALAVGTPHIAALAIVSGKVASGGLSPLSSGKIWAGFTGNFPREENKPVPPNGLTVALFQVNAATGTMTNPANMNDNNTGTNAEADALGEYAEVDFGATYYISQWRHFGHAAMVGDGVWKKQYYDGSWHDWVTGIAIRKTADWSAWVTERLVAASKIRLVCTTVDTSFSNIAELEMK